MTGKLIKLLFQIYSTLEFHYYTKNYVLGLFYVKVPDILYPGLDLPPQFKKLKNKQKNAQLNKKRKSPWRHHTRKERIYKD